MLAKLIKCFMPITLKDESPCFWLYTAKIDTALHKNERKNAVKEYSGKEFGAFSALVNTGGIKQ